MPDEIRVITASFQVNLTLSASLWPAESNGGHHVPLNSAPKCLNSVIYALNSILSVLLHNTVKQVDLTNLFLKGSFKGADWQFIFFFRWGSQVLAIACQVPLYSIFSWLEHSGVTEPLCILIVWTLRIVKVLGLIFQYLISIEQTRVICRLWKYHAICFILIDCCVFDCHSTEEAKNSNSKLLIVYSGRIFQRNLAELLNLAQSDCILSFLRV